MTDSFTLSLAAVDISSELLGLGPAPFPFEVPHNGQSPQQRAGIREAVFADLRRRGLAKADRLRPEVADALTVLYASDSGAVAVTAIGLLDGHQQLVARSALAGGTAVRAVQNDQLVTFDWVRPSALVQAMVELLPEERAAVDQSVTIEEGAAPPSARPEGAQFARMVRAPRTGHAAQLSAARTILARPRTRIGQFAIVLGGSRGSQPAVELGWFDTDAGRYLVHTRVGDGGRTWVTYAPADRARLAHLLNEQLSDALAAMSG